MARYSCGEGLGWWESYGGFGSSGGGDGQVEWWRGLGWWDSRGGFCGGKMQARWRLRPKGKSHLGFVPEYNFTIVPNYNKNELMFWV